MHAPEILAALRAAEDIKSRGGSWTETRRAFEVITVMPEATEAVRAEVADRILIAATLRYELPDTEVARVLESVADDLKGLRPLSRCAAIASACTRRPALARRWLPDIIAELRGMDPDDPEVSSWLAHARAELESATQ